MSASAIAPDGARWQVGRRWAPSRIRLRRRDRDGDGFDIGDLGFDDGPLAFLAVIAAVVVLLLVVWPIVAIALELVLLLLAFLASLAGRVVFRRPWTVVARSLAPGASCEHEWRVVGWRPSGRLIDDAAEALRAGTELPAGATTAGASLPSSGDALPHR